MLVPKFRAKPAGTINVAGQPSSFTVPAGAMSAAAVGAAGGFKKFASDAAVWGTYVQKMHRENVVTSKMTEARTAVDRLFIRSQKAPVASPLHGSGEGILGTFDNAIPNIRKTTLATVKDPLLRRMIDANLAEYIEDKRAQLSRYHTGRLVDQRQAGINAARADTIHRASSMLPVDWNGDDDTLPHSLRRLIEKEENAQRDAANTGLITAVDAEQANRTLRTEIAVNAANAHYNSIQTSQQADQLKNALDDSENFRWLSPKDRNRLIGDLVSKTRELADDEYTDAERQRKDAARALTDRQEKRFNMLMQRFMEVRDPSVPSDSGEASALPTVKELRELAAEDNGHGLAQGDLLFFTELLQAEGVSDSDPQLVAELYEDVSRIAADPALGAAQRRRAITEITSRAAAQIQLGPRSRLTQTDYLAFFKWASTIAGQEQRAGETLDLLRMVENNAAPRDPVSKILDDPADILRVLEARETYYRGIAAGLTPHDAAVQALRRVGVAMAPDGTTKRQGPFFPIELPDTFPADTAKWTPEDVSEAKAWVVENTQTLSRTAYKKTLDDIEKIQRYLSRGRK